MTKIKNGRLLLTVPAIIGMAVCIALCILLSCLTLAGQSPARRFIFAAVFILVVLSTFSSLYTGDFKRLTTEESPCARSADFAKSNTDLYRDL